ncbi:hypothetical protein CEQ90_09205 [Lewinellaceae bacterium SD302]|nr:hypothetical protein CEQ90_09205 [Lewinellaceae bacterium SD302]
MYQNDDLLDQPLDAGPPEESEAPQPILRYLITLVLFPAALLRLRSGSMSAEELVSGGLWSSLQFFVAGVIFTIFRFYYHRYKGVELKRKRLLGYALQTAVELVVVVGVVQLLWQYFASA